MYVQAMPVLSSLSTMPVLSCWAWRFFFCFSVVFLLAGKCFSASTCMDDAHFHGNTVMGPAEKLIKALNLSTFPISNDDITSDDEDVVPRIVEHRISLHPFGITDEDLGHHAGYFSIPGTYAARMFYLFFESRGNKTEDPVVIWMSGGPGCSSELALFYENGPYKITDKLTLILNDYGWDKVSNVIFVDQPVGTGFSYSSDDRDIPHDEQGVSEDMFQFLQAFFQLHPEYAKNEFFVTGESYAGHYVPAVTSRIHQANKRQEGVPINLKGFAIGNGLTNPEIQYAAYADYAFQMGLINKTVYQIVSDMYPECQEAIQKCGNNGSSTCSRAYSVCTSIFNTILYFLDDVNYYDIRKKCDGNLCYDFSNMETYLNQNSVKQALNVGDIDFVSCNSLVYENMVVDWMRNLEVGIPALLDDGIQLLVYAGEYDLICNWLGNARWVSAIEWSGSDNYRAANFTKFAVDGEEAGLFISYGPLTFLKVHNAGHMVPMDQPKASLDMIMRFTQGGSLDGVSFPREIVYSTSRNTER